MNDNPEHEASEDPGTIFLITGQIDDAGNAWFGDYTQGKPFWAAVLIPKENEEAFNEALEKSENLGTEIDIAIYANEIVKWGGYGNAYPSTEELAELELAYGDHKIIRMNSPDENNPAETDFPSL